jgi:hypothetical protein
LREALDEFGPGNFRFENIDVSKVPWEPLSFSVLTDLLRDYQVETKRFKAFRCGLDDDSLGEGLADWFSMLPPTGLPNEIHLSHNKLSQNGFDAIFNCIEAKRQELEDTANPIWLRVENNSVDANYVTEMAEQGRVLYCQDISGSRRPHPTACVAMPQLQTQGHSPAQTALAPAPPAMPPTGKGLHGKGRPGLSPQPRIVVPPATMTAPAPKAGWGKAAGKGGQDARKGGMSQKGDSKGWASSVQDSDTEERVHPSDKTKTAYTFDGFLEFANGDLPKAQRMWKESRPVQESKAKGKEKGSNNWGSNGNGGNSWDAKTPQDSQEEKRVHPSDKDKQPYTYDGFLQFTKGDEQEAQKMWKASKPVNDSGGPSWKQDSSAWKGHNGDSKQSHKNETSWQQNHLPQPGTPPEALQTPLKRSFSQPVPKAATASNAKRARTEPFDAFGGQPKPAAVKPQPKAALKPQPKAASAVKPLPPGWTEEHSEEFGIPFYWKQETEESSWERPTA